MRFLLKFSYDGSNYAGFQNQPGLNTIQFQLEEALKKVNDNNKTTICATGRTDKGVHALCQYAHTDIDWFNAQEWPHLLDWLQRFLDSARFKQIMPKHTPWQEGDEIVIFPSAI